MLLLLRILTDSPHCFFYFSISPSLPLSGWIVSLAALNTSVPVGAIMMINAIFFTSQAAMGVVMLKKVNTIFTLEGEFEGLRLHFFDKVSVTLSLRGLINGIISVFRIFEFIYMNAIIVVLRLILDLILQLNGTGEICLVMSM